MAEWTTKQISTAFLAEIRERFEKENAEWMDAHMDKTDRRSARLEVSKHWIAYTSSTIKVDVNYVRVTLPPGWRLDPDFVHMFEMTSRGWNRPSIVAVLAEGVPCLVIEIFLVDSWDDERETAWKRGKTIERM